VEQEEKKQLSTKLQRVSSSAKKAAGKDPVALQDQLDQKNQEIVRAN
jgi:hypothetical protein